MGRQAPAPGSHAPTRLSRLSLCGADSICMRSLTVAQGRCVWGCVYHAVELAMTLPSPAQVDLDGTVLPAGSGSSSSSDNGSDAGEQRMDTDAAPPALAPPKGPIVDAEGFELVQRRRGRSQRA